MKVGDKEIVLDMINQEGFDYCFIHYSQCDEVDDDKFHELRENYIKSRNKLAEYIGFED